MLTIAQSGIDPKLWLYFLLLLAVLFVGAIVIFAIRRAMFTHENSDLGSAGGGLLEHLDEMKRTGQITNEEYKTTRQSIIKNASQRLRDEDSTEPDAKP